MEQPIWTEAEGGKAAYCQHNVDSQVHCCICHSGFAFPGMEHEPDCPFSTTDLDADHDRRNDEAAAKWQAQADAAVPRMIITVQGGLVQEVYCDSPVEVRIIDEDTDGADVDRLTHFEGREPGMAFDANVIALDNTPDRESVDHYWHQIDKAEADASTLYCTDSDCLGVLRYGLCPKCSETGYHHESGGACGGCGQDDGGWLWLPDNAGIRAEHLGKNWEADQATARELVAISNEAAE